MLKPMKLIVASNSDVSTFCPLPVRSPRRDCGKNPVTAVKSPEMVRERRSRSLGLLQIGKNAQQSAQRLTECVVAGFVPIRAFWPKAEIEQ